MVAKFGKMVPFLNETLFSNNKSNNPSPKYRWNNYYDYSGTTALSINSRRGQQPYRHAEGHSIVINHSA